MGAWHLDLVWELLINTLARLGRSGRCHLHRRSSETCSLSGKTHSDTHDLVGCGCALRKEGVEEEMDDIATQKKAIKVVVL